MSSTSVIVETIVSHSEVDAYLACRRKHFYSFANGGLEALKMSDALVRGIQGHRTLEVFFTARKDGLSWQESLDKMAEFSMYLYVQPDANLPVLADVQRLTMGFLDFHRDRIESWTILHVEGEFWLPVGDNIQYPFKPDLIVKEKGFVVVVDYKFIYDFYNDNIMDILPQLVKYIGALRAIGIFVKYGIYAMIRYRKMKDMVGNNIYRLHEVRMTNERIKTTFLDQITITKEIADLKAGSYEDWNAKAIRSASAWNCKMCSFVPLCGAELNGSTGKIIRQVDYAPNSYGYHRKELAP